MQRMLQQLQKDVEAGDNLSKALSRFPKQFDKTYVNLVKASEASGTLSKMLDRIAIQSRMELDTRQQVQGALMYPAGMLVMCVGVVIFLLTNVFPKITPMFATKGLKLPGPTKFLMALSDALMHHWVWFIVGTVAVVGFLFYASRQRWGRLAFDWFWLNVPVLGGVIRKVTISRSLRTLATTINAGVPMLDAIQLCGDVSSNLFYEETWRDVGEKVTAGKQICESLQGNKLFPTTLMQMISSGESTGKLGEVLNKVSDYYDREVSTSIKAATSLIEPIMVSVMGGIIGTIALAMLLPIFTLSGSAGR
jgi:type IV pilus assembly protein PilC